MNELRFWFIRFSHVSSTPLSEWRGGAPAMGLPMGVLAARACVFSCARPRAAATADVRLDTTTAWCPAAHAAQRTG